MSLLSLSDIAKAYAGVPALRSVSLDIAPGEIHALMGENGAGKSTLIKILAGVVSADSGDILMDGKPVSIAGPGDAQALGLRFIHQELNVVPALSVSENIFLGHAYPRRLGGLVDWTALHEAAHAAMARLGIGHIDPRTKMGRLATGDRMLVSISTAFLDGDGPARLYVMDEPTAALTGEESERLFAVLESIRGQGRSVIYVSHRLDEVRRLCDRVTVLRDGERIATRAMTDTSHDDLIQMMIGRRIQEAYPSGAGTIGDKPVLSVRGLEGEGIGPLSFDLRPGEIVGVAGLAGAGQSEVLRLVAGADRASAGSIELRGARLGRGGLASSWRKGIAYVPRERRSEGLVLSRAIYENVTLPHLARFSRMGTFLARGAERRIADERGRDVRLKARGPRQICRELSGGNQQKVVFAKALSGQPSVLVLDEPTRGVDVGAKFDIYSVLRELSGKGLAVLMSSSDFPELLGMCDRIIVMRDGAMADLLEARGLEEDVLLSACFGRAGQDRPASGIGMGG